MIYKKRLRVERENQTSTRTFTIEMESDDFLGYKVTGAEVRLEGTDFSSRSSQTRLVEIFQSKKDAFAFAEDLVQASIEEGLVLLDSEIGLSN